MVYGPRAVEDLIVESLELAARMRRWVVQRVEGAVRRYLSDLRVPGYFAGHRINGDYSVDLGWVMSMLHQAGVTEVAGWDLRDAMRRILRQIDGETTETFYSYRTAEMLLAFGPFEGNELLRGMTAAEIANVAAAVDSTHIYNQGGAPLGGRPNNYWGVLARCEDSRRRLGLPFDQKIFEEAVGHCRRILFANPVGFFDDSREMSGRVDIYSADVHLFLEPLWERFDASSLRANLAAHARLLEVFALEDGASFAWGRSIGALSVCMTMELGAVMLRDGLCGNPARVLRLVENAFEKFSGDGGWMREDLIDAHRYRMTMNYRGPHRLLQMTMDCLAKVAYAAKAMEERPQGQFENKPDEREGATELFPARDEWVKLNEGNAGVWMFRNRVLAFQLAAVDGGGSDYVAGPRGPGLFETPVDSPMVCWAPRVAALSADGKEEAEYLSLGVPARVEKLPGGLRLEYAGWRRSQGKESPPQIGGKRLVEYRVDGDTLRVREVWEFDGAASVRALSLTIPERVGRLLKVDWTCAAEHSGSVVNVQGMQFWRSFWGEFSRVHQIDIVPPADGKPIEIEYTVTPSVRVAQGPSDHDYTRGMYDRMPADGVREIGFASGQCGASAMNVDWLFGDAEVVHVGWPEHLFSPHGMSEEEFDRKYGEFVQRLRTSGKKVVWTLHNRRPHGWVKDRGVELYRRWAPLADACLHHSQWGMELMKREYPFRADCLHVVVPHGHYGEQMRANETREELEREFGLPKCAIRIGVLGRYQKEKQVEMLIQAFLAAGRADAQLAITAYRNGVTLPDGPGVYRLPRKDWMTRTEIARHTKVCDVLLAAHTGDTYLTSGLVGDAVGMGITMLVPEWEFFREIMGDAAIYHDNTQDGIAAAIAALTAEKVEAAKSKSRALYDAYDWRTLSPKVWELLRRVRN